MKYSYCVMHKAHTLYDAMGDESIHYCDATIAEIHKKLEQDSKNYSPKAKNIVYNNIDFYLDVRLYIKIYKNRLLEGKQYINK